MALSIAIQFYFKIVLSNRSQYRAFVPASYNKFYYCSKADETCIDLNVAVIFLHFFFVLTFSFESIALSDVVD